MDDAEILKRIERIVEEEHRLRERVVEREIDPSDERERVRRLEESLDQCWDLPRQRRARREFGEDPDAAQARPIGEVESYQQ